MINQDHGISLLIQCIQRRHETAATFGGRYTEVAKKSQIKDQDIIVHYIADGQKEKKTEKKIIRGECKTLKQAIILCVEEETYLRNFSLYPLGKNGKDLDKLDKPQKVVKTQPINHNKHTSYVNNKKVSMQEGVYLLGVK